MRKRMLRYLFVVSLLSCVSDVGWPHSQSSGSIGYGSSTSVITDKIQEGFYSGFQLGFESSLPMDLRSQAVTVEQVRDGSPLGAATSAKRLLDRGVSAFFGFPGSTDALIAGKIAQSSEVIAVFPGCNHSGLARLGPYVFSTGHSGENEVWAQLKIAGDLGFKRGLAILNPLAAPSASLRSVYNSEQTKSKFRHVDIVTANLTGDLKLEDQIVKDLKAKKYDFLIFTPYPEASVGFVDQLLNSSIDLPVIAGSAWGTVDSDVMRRYVSGKKASFYMQTSWLGESESGKVFRKVFRNKYAKEPTAESAYGYDLGVIAATVLTRITGRVTPQSFRQAFTSNLCFSNLSVGSLCFPKGGGHATRRIHFLKFTPKGFRPAYEVQL